MSYRTLKRILGETNFEVKCLVLFGFGLSVLAVLTFALYWWQTSSLVDEQNKTTARLLMAPMIQQRHWEWFAKLKSNFEEAGNPAGDGEPNPIQVPKPNERPEPVAAREAPVAAWRGSACSSSRSSTEMRVLCNHPGRRLEII